jgi:hypothetical protein
MRSVRSRRLITVFVVLMIVTRADGHHDEHDDTMTFQENVSIVPSCHRAHREDRRSVQCSTRRIAG